MNLKALRFNTFVLIAALVLIAIIAVSVWTIITQSVTANLHQAITDATRPLVSAAVKLLAPPVSQMDAPLANQQITQLSEDPNVKYIGVRDLNGRLITEIAKNYSVDEQASQNLSAQALQQSSAVQKFATSKLFFVNPIVSGTEQVGTVEFIFDISGVQQNQQITLIIISVTVFLAFIFTVLFIMLLARLISAPLEQLTTAAAAIGQGSLDTPIEARGNKEMVTLGVVLDQMRLRLKENYLSLEQQVENRTQALEKRTREFKAAAQVSREAAAIRDLEQLLHQAVSLISNQFGYYHSGIFLIDNNREYAVLRAASSTGGQRMLARNHKLKIGEVGIVGYVAARGTPRIALDVGTDKAYFNNPDLPQTRSEVGLPMKVGNQVIGVLDVQSEEGGAFTEDDIEILQVMADQIALALENARLIEETQRALRELNTLYGQQARQGWDRRLANQPLAFIYNRFGIQPAASAVLKIDQTKPNQLTIPIMLRGQPLGSLVLQREENQRPWTEADKALAQDAITQIASALENARLLEEIRSRAQQERVLGQISASIQASRDLDAVLKTAVHEIGLAIDASRVQIRLGSGDDELKSQPSSTTAADPVANRKS